MKNTISIQFYDDDYELTSYNESDCKNIQIQINANEKEQKYLRTDFISQCDTLDFQKSDDFLGSFLYIIEPISKFYSERSRKFSTLHGEPRYEMGDEYQAMYKIYKKIYKHNLK